MRRRGGLLFPERRARLLESQRSAIDHGIRVQRPDAAADDVGRDGQRLVPRGYANVNAAARPQRLALHLRAVRAQVEHGHEAPRTQRRALDLLPA